MISSTLTERLKICGLLDCLATLHDDALCRAVIDEAVKLILAGEHMRITLTPVRPGPRGARRS